MAARDLAVVLVEQVQQAVPAVVLLIPDRVLQELTMTALALALAQVAHQELTTMVREPDLGLEAVQVVRVQAAPTTTVQALEQVADLEALVHLVQRIVARDLERVRAQAAVCVPTGKS